MKFSLFRLSFPHGIHIGDEKPDNYSQSQDFIRSDTLYAAFSAVITELKGIDEEYIPKFTISSLFPFKEIEGKIEYFFPRPKMRIGFNEPDKLLDYRKDIKGIQWIGKDFFERILHGQNFTTDEVGRFIHDSCFSPSLANENSKIYYNEIRERVAIPRHRREDDQPNPYVFDVLHFGKGAGLYFLASETDQDIIEQCLFILKDRGLGTDRNLGLGHFTYVKDDLELKVPDNFSTGINLGLLLPNSSEEWQNWTSEVQINKDGEEIIKPGYELIKRGGWITVPGYQKFRKGSVYMMEEGSILKLNGKQSIKAKPLIFGNPGISLKPNIADTVKLPPVLRCGKSFVIPTKMNNDV
ncbi:type III-A CRISPR-associated RAMP protein Csm4 [Membranicola marinus]|uniref:CRISPR system Cms protein Csm4 n=1 Tax=Membranihabitans marinus TaxID=1227546 RepID=A0A953HZV5_9BACT|nr:type III-A CRISPR-associated RAMP protein Csm4 [Membranihabitans marinus]MBY5959776.1 type III-A CRISPR-associated RAMP protein Csm4 [Membranihabitans marinus]